MLLQRRDYRPRIFLLPEIHPEWWIALFTLTLWIATNLLWRTSIRHANHMERSVKIAEKAAAAARDSADALPILERAFVFIYTEFQQSYLDSTKTIADAVERHRTIFDITTAFEFVNHGKTPAIIKEISFGSFVVEGKTEFPQYPASILDSVVVVPSSGVWPERMAKRSIIPLPDEYKNVHEFRPNIVINNVTEAQGEAILNGKAFVVALAKVSYLDIFDRQHETAICRIYDGHTFAEHGGEKYNYRT